MDKVGMHITSSYFICLSPGPNHSFLTFLEFDSIKDADILPLQAYEIFE